VGGACASAHPLAMVLLAATLLAACAQQQRAAFPSSGDALRDFDETLAASVVFDKCAPSFNWKTVSQAAFNARGEAARNELREQLAAAAPGDAENDRKADLAFQQRLERTLTDAAAAVDIRGCADPAVRARLRPELLR